MYSKLAMEGTGAKMEAWVEIKGRNQDYGNFHYMEKDIW